MAVELADAGLITGAIVAAQTLPKLWQMRKGLKQTKIEIAQETVDTALENPSPKLRGFIEGITVPITTRLDAAHLVDLRLQMLQLIQHTPEKHEAIYKLADEYLRLGGNSYVKKILDEWAASEGITPPKG